MSEVKVYEGHLLAPGKRFAVVATRWNAMISERLVEGAVSALIRHGVHTKDIEVVKAPGSFEIPVICRAIASTGRYSAIVTVGAILDGETDHYQSVCQALISGIVTVSHEFGIPITFGVITSKDFDSALQRAGGKMGNKGEEAAIAAIEAISVITQICSLGVSGAKNGC